MSIKRLNVVIIYVRLDSHAGLLTLSAKKLDPTLTLAFYAVFWLPNSGTMMLGASMCGSVSKSSLTPLVILLRHCPLWSVFSRKPLEFPET